jgi:hypothetical protein
MGDERPEDPEELAALRALGDAIDAADPVPGWLVEVAASAPALARLDDELLELLDTSTAGVRSGDDSELVFTAGGRTVEVRVQRRESRRWLDGVVEPVDAAEVRLEQRAGSTTAPVDDVGHFELAGVPAGLGRLVVVAGDGRTYATSWVIW